MLQVPSDGQNKDDDQKSRTNKLEEEEAKISVNVDPIFPGYSCNVQGFREGRERVCCTSAVGWSRFDYKEYKKNQTQCE